MERMDIKYAGDSSFLIFDFTPDFVETLQKYPYQHHVSCHRRTGKRWQRTAKIKI